MFLSLTLLLVTVVFLCAVILFTDVIPGIVEKKLGAPGPDLPFSREIYLGLQLIRKLEALDQSVYSNTAPSTFIVKRGISANSVALALHNDGFIENAEDILLYWEYKGLDRFIREGVYLIEPHFTTREIADRLAGGKVGYETFAFLAGWRKEEVDTLLVSAGLISKPLDLRLSDCREEFSGMPYGVEGYLHPGSYQIPDEIQEKEIYCMFVNEFFSSLPENYPDLILDHGLNLHQTITLASIVQREMISPGEGPRIAGVFYNRLKRAMPLQSDPTVQYAVATENNGPPWWDIDISVEDLKIDSPYNTYQVDSFPPAPICNPGSNALMSVFFPESHNYLYFRSACDDSGKHTFSETYDDHLAAACQ